MVKISTCSQVIFSVDGPSLEKQDGCIVGKWTEQMVEMGGRVADIEDAVEQAERKMVEQACIIPYSEVFDMDLNLLSPVIRYTCRL